ncbi:hypothetical protein ElyMa_000576700 [Elysia marginata]|uniref:Uncharacterized protein n=1 Tax=Elysia marginata TaxID=1093978 RepID=A0AAV4G4U3_9GAST|nr:hypothetical protein ElyMa_000576700 [Elysia marginata]
MGFSTCNFQPPFPTIKWIFREDSTHCEELLEESQIIEEKSTDYTAVASHDTCLQHPTVACGTSSQRKGSKPDSTYIIRHQVSVQDTGTGLWSPATIVKHSGEPMSYEYIIKTPDGTTFRRNRLHRKDSTIPRPADHPPQAHDDDTRDDRGGKCASTSTLCP